jgi:hypothetical protein
MPTYSHGHTYMFTSGSARHRARLRRGLPPHRGYRTTPYPIHARLYLSPPHTHVDTHPAPRRVGARGVAGGIGARGCPQGVHVVTRPPPSSVRRTGAAPGAGGLQGTANTPPLTHTHCTPPWPALQSTHVVPQAVPGQDQGAHLPQRLGRHPEVALAHVSLWGTEGVAQSQGPRGTEEDA